MKKYVIGTSLILGTLTTPLYAEESKNFYLSIGGGVAFTSDVTGDLDGTTAEFETNNPLNYSFAIGKEFEEWRLEFNYSATTLSSDSITVTAGGNSASSDITPDYELGANTFMIYGYKDIPSNSKFTPYLGAGLGVSSLSTDANTYTVGGDDIVVTDEQYSVFTFGLKGGVGYEIAENTSLYSEASYINYSSFSTDDGVDYDSTNSFIISAGLRFNF